MAVNRPASRRKPASRRWPGGIALLWPIPVLALVALLAWGSRSLWPTIFFTLTLLWPMSLTARRIGGARWGNAFGMTFSALLVLQAVLPLPLPDRPPATLERRFSSLDEAMRHIIAPQASAEWRRLRERSAATEVWVYVMTVLDDTAAHPQLSLAAGERHIGTLDASARLTPGQPPAVDRHEWYRVRLDPDLLRLDAPIELVVRPDASAPFTPGSVGLVGGFSYRPTNPPTPSAFFDGARWATEPESLLSPPAGEARDAQLDKPMRYFVELRLIDPETRRIIAALY